MRSVRVADEASQHVGALTVGNALTAVARTRTAGRGYVMCSVANADSSDGQRWYPAGPAGPSVPMWVPDSRQRDQGLACDGQLLAVPPGRYEWIYLLVSNHHTGTPEIWLHHQDVVDPEWLYLGGRAMADAQLARVPVIRPEPLMAVRLPEAPRLRVHAVTLVSPLAPDLADRAPMPSEGQGPGCHLVHLAAHVNCVGIEPTPRPGKGAFNIWNNTFPIEDLPPAGTVTTVGGVPFRMPLADGDRPDNIRCRGQRIGLPVDRADWLHLLVAAERRSEDLLAVHYTDGTTRTQWLRVSDFWPETASRFGETLAFRTSSMLYPNHVDSRMPPAIWRQRVPVSVRAEVAAVTLPNNPAIHVFALTVLDEEARPQ